MLPASHSAFWAMMPGQRLSILLCHPAVGSMSVAPATISLLSSLDELLIQLCEEAGSQPALCSQIRVNRTFSNVTHRPLYTYTTIGDTPFLHRFPATLVAFKANPDRLSWVRRRSIRYSFDQNSAMCRANSRLVGSILCTLPNLWNLGASHRFSS